MAIAASANVLRRTAIHRRSVERLCSRMSVRAMLIVPSFLCSALRSPVFLAERTIGLSVLVGLLALPPLLRPQSPWQNPPAPTSLPASARFSAQPANVRGQSRHMAAAHGRVPPAAGPVPHP